MSKAIKVENLSKAYQLGEIGTGTLSNDLKRWAYKVRGKEDPFLKIGETNDRTTKGESNMVWSLKDLNFEIEQGDAVGIIGRNGAGKSTLLKILSRVTSPTTGSVKVKGRVASLLEVGTGFHPELTGKENIFLNGAILGMRKAEIKKHFDAIVDFAGVERYIDTPVKRYSSGMYVRSAFAVAAHLESEILIVDEVLAVGDAEFQKKCLGKMKDVSKGEGRTVLFVSHNLIAVKTLCNNGIVLTNGNMAYSGSSIECINYYQNENRTENNKVIFSNSSEYNNSEFRLKSIVLKADNHEESLFDDSEILLATELEIKDNEASNYYHLSFVVKNQNNEILFTLVNQGKAELKKGYNKLFCVIPKAFLNVGGFSLSLYIIRNINTSVFCEDDLLTFKISQSERKIGEWMGIEPGFIKTNFRWYNESV